MIKSFFVKSIFVLFFLTLTFIRVYNVHNQPPGLHIDEVSFGVDAKSIVESGLDTWGVRYPTYFKAYGEYKAPGQTYFMALVYALRNEMDTLTTRLPNVVFGLGMLLIFILTLRAIWRPLPLLALTLGVVILGLSPWHFALSRVFYESYGGAFWLATSLYGTILSWTNQKYRRLGFWLGTLGAIVAGYWYPSLRYVALGTMAWSLLLSPPPLPKKRHFLLALVLTLTLGFGWVKELVSSAGLSRLHFYNTSVTTGQTLSIDEKRQFCYLSFDQNPVLTKWCYVLWNKPVDRLLTTVKTYADYLGTTFLFLDSGGDYGTDSSYGAYHLTALPLYLLSFIFILKSIYQWFVVARSGRSLKSEYRTTLYLTGVLIIAIFPAATTGGIAVHLVASALYVLMLIFMLGLKVGYEYLMPLYPRLLQLIVLFLLATTLFLAAQSLTHYYAVFTHSNDVMWTSDTQEVFNYVRDNSFHYDLIIDTALHGPQAGYFFGDITTATLHQTKQHSSPDRFGFAYLIKAGKYEWVQSGTLDLIACQYRRSNDKILVISNPQDRVNVLPILTTYTWNKVHKMRELYNLDDVKAALSQTQGGINAYCAQYSL